MNYHEDFTIEQVGMRNGRPKLIKSPELRHVIKRSCRNCGWKLGSKPVVVELFGIERVDRKAMVSKQKWCVQWAECPTVCPCSEWVEKR